MGKRARLIALQAAMTVVALNIWTGSPLMALWIGSRLQGYGAPKMGPVFAVIALLTLFSLLLAQLLARLAGTYERLTGQGATVQRHVAWLRSMRAERRRSPGQRATLTASERVLVLMVVVAIATFEVWFFFFSASPIDHRSGRGQVEPPSTASRA
jgi:hypothetical protein